MVNPSGTKFPPTKFFTQHVAGAKINVWLKIMALFRYLHPINSTLDPYSPLSSAVPRGVIEEVNKELKKAETQPKK